MTSPRLGTATFPSRNWAEGKARTLARRIVSGLRFPSEALFSYEVSSLMGRGHCLPRSRKRPALSQVRWLKDGFARRRCARPSIAEMCVAPVPAPWPPFNSPTVTALPETECERECLTTMPIVCSNDTVIVRNSFGMCFSLCSSLAQRAK